MRIPRALLLVSVLPCALAGAAACTGRTTGSDGGAGSTDGGGPGIDGGGPGTDGGGPGVDGSIPGTDASIPTGPCIPPGGATVDYTVLPEPAVTLPPAGSAYVDPTFGTTIIRVTDASAGGDSYHAYGYWPVFNAGSTRFHIQKAGSPTLYDFDPTTHAIAEVGPLFAGASCNWEDSAWSHTDPNVLYCHTYAPKRLYSYDVTTPGAAGLTLVHDFDADLTGAGDVNLNQMLVDGSDEVFTFHTRDDTGTTHTAVAYERSTDTVWTRAYDGAGLDETHVDHGGTYIVVHLAGSWDVWDFRTDTVVTVNMNATERGGLCHQVAGTNLYVGGDCWDTGFLARALDDPLSWTHLVTFYQPDGVSLEWDFDVHLSLNHSDERWFATSLYTPGGADPAAWSPWEQEILAVATDGSFVTRLAHHHSDYPPAGYWASPRVSTSYDGRFAVFDSNFDGGGIDVFIVVLPTICAP
jgi:hypothetical protein